jgi:hypothetical protein
MTPKKLTLEKFVSRYSEANQTEMEIAVAAVKNLKPDCTAYAPAKKCVDAWQELLEVLETAGFEL